MQRITQRGMSKNLIASIVKSGKVLDQGGKYLYISKKGAVVIDSAGRIITAYSAKYFDANMRQVVRKLFG